ncbi:hypothetical protein ACTQ4E_00920 [Lawsonibacter sp. LCP25S3_G6]|uniref:hypothetical protein n=1 Tax=unclassified Lawsonibacter TaxID=2617946 RepID=UPI003F963A53
METEKPGNRPGKFSEWNVENYVENVENPWKQWKKRNGILGPGEKKNMYRKEENNNSKKSKL